MNTFAGRRTCKLAAFLEGVYSCVSTRHAQHARRSCAEAWLPCTVAAGDTSTTLQQTGAWPAQFATFNTVLQGAWVASRPLPRGAAMVAGNPPAGLQQLVDARQGGVALRPGLALRAQQQHRAQHAGQSGTLLMHPPGLGAREGALQEAISAAPRGDRTKLDCSCGPGMALETMCTTRTTSNRPSRPESRACCATSSSRSRAGARGSPSSCAVPARSSHISKAQRRTSRRVVPGQCSCVRARWWWGRGGLG